MVLMVTNIAYSHHFASVDDRSFQWLQILFITIALHSLMMSHHFATVDDKWLQILRRALTLHLLMTDGYNGYKYCLEPSLCIC